MKGKIINILIETEKYLVLSKMLQSISKLLIMIVIAKFISINKKAHLMILMIN
jgi:hypothetical protein